MNTLTEQKKVLRIENLSASTNEKKILEGLSLEVKPGEIHALMGPNGSGKSTLSYVIAGHPKYKVETGRIFFGEKELLTLSPAERSKEGIFLAFQYPMEVAGLSLSQFLFASLKARNQNLSPVEYSKELKTALAKIGKDASFASRHLNVGFSGGEKKRAEILQLLMLKPQLAILDETDSGLDVDALQVVADAINSLRSPEFSALVITHYPKMLELLKPDVVHIIANGKIVLSGSPELIKKVENEGYGWLEK